MKIRDLFPRHHHKTTAGATLAPRAPKSPIELYVAGGGSLEAASPRTAAFLWEAEKTHLKRQERARVARRADLQRREGATKDQETW